MDVKFVTVRKSNLNAVPVVDGQVIAVEDANGFYYDQNSQRYPVSCVRVLPKLEGMGRYEEICVVTSGEAPGLYVWDDTSKSYWLIANKDTDLYIRFVKSANLEKVYVTGTNGEDDSWESYWNENVHMDLKNGTITAVEFKGKASDSYKADNATHSQSSDEAEHAKVSDKIGTQTVGDPFTAVYVLNGVPTACSHSVKKDVPEDAQFTDTTYDVFVGATTESEGSSGLVPVPTVADTERFLKGNGEWSDVVIPDMVGCTKESEGKSGLVPKPDAGKYNSFLKGDGTWAAYSAGYGLELVSLTFNLQDSGVTPGSYGPLPNAENMTVYVGDYVPVPHITVDKYGRVTNIQEVMCYVGGGGSGPAPDDVSLMQFSFTPDGTHLLCTYEDMESALATFDVDDRGHLIAEYKYDPTPMTLSVNEKGHCIATSVSDASTQSGGANENSSQLDTSQSASIETESVEGTQNE